MSLFGTSPDETSPAAQAAAASKSRLSLFDDEPSPAPANKSSLFDDDDEPSWGMPTPKKQGRAELLRNLLPASDVPESYIDTFDNMLKAGDDAGGKVNPAGVAKVLSAAMLSADDQSRIMNIIAPTGRLTDLGRNEFSVLLALIGLAQEGEDVTLDGVDERRRKLPEPDLPTLSLPAIQELAAKPSQRPSTPPKPVTPTSRSQTQNRNSMDFPEADPWSSPALHKNHAHDPIQARPAPQPVTNGSQEHLRTTSNFTTTSPLQFSSKGSNGTSHSEAPPVVAAAGVWGSYGDSTSTPFGQTRDSGISGTFGGPIGGDAVPNDRAAATPSRAFGGGRVTGSNVEEQIIITLLPEKEGVFMFQHNNYQVTSARRGSKVVRRYSDFVWLLDCLQKRYPFRQLPLLPPKRVGLNGNHIAADGTFLEKRRRGLVRFTNALVRHPVLNQEQLVTMFLTVPTELSVWRKQATISVQEEFAGKPLPPGLEDSLPPTLNDLFETTRTGVRRSAEIYINMCNQMDRLCKRNEGLAADHLRISLSLQTLADASQDTYATDTNDVPLLNEGLNATAKHLSNTQSLLEDESRAWDMGVLEDLKRQRDALVSVRDMFERRDRYDKDTIPYLEKRIARNEEKLIGLRDKPEGLVKPGEIEKVTEAIIKDKESIVAQHARGVFIKECIRDELIFFQTSQYHVSRLAQDWAQERVKYSELAADNWRQLNEEVESMPVGE